MSKKRIQLTLFIGEDEARIIENIRKEFNPKQFELISSHVTLCKEDELEQIDEIMQNIINLNLRCITIDFGPAVRFSDGKGVIIPAIGNNEQFNKLREIVLKDVNSNPRKYEPHITLMHPRNSTCSDDLFQHIEKIKIPNQLKFTKISLIQQQKEEDEWIVLKEFMLDD